MTSHHEGVTRSVTLSLPFRKSDKSESGEGRGGGVGDGMTTCFLGGDEGGPMIVVIVVVVVFIDRVILRVTTA